MIQLLHSFLLLTNNNFFAFLFIHLRHSLINYYFYLLIFYREFSRQTWFRHFTGRNKVLYELSILVLFIFISVYIFIHIVISTYIITFFFHFISCFAYHIIISTLMTIAFYSIDFEKSNWFYSIPALLPCTFEFLYLGNCIDRETFLWSDRKK